MLPKPVECFSYRCIASYIVHIVFLKLHNFKNTKLRVPLVLHDPSREKSHYTSSWHMFLPSDVTHGFNK